MQGRNRCSGPQVGRTRCDDTFGSVTSASTRTDPWQGIIERFEERRAGSGHDGFYRRSGRRGETLSGIRRQSVVICAEAQEQKQRSKPHTQAEEGCNICKAWYPRRVSWGAVGAMSSVSCILGEPREVEEPHEVVRDDENTRCNEADRCQ